MEEFIQDCLQIPGTSVTILLVQDFGIATTPRSPQPAHINHDRYDDYTVII